MSDVIKNVFNLSDEDLVNYVRDRVIELEISSDDSRHTLPVIQNGFISKNTEIKTSDSDRIGYCMEGIDYLEYVKYLRREVKDYSDVGLIAYTAHYVSNYFDFNIFTNKEDNREQIIYESSIGLEDGKLPSINCLRNGNQAVCLEHSTLFQNCLSFLGFDVSNYLMVALVNNVIKGHSVNIVHLTVGDEVKHLYYDMVSMEAYSEDDGEFAGPTVRLINDEEYNNFINGIAPLTVVRRCSKKKGGYEITFYLPKSIQNLEELKLRIKKDN